MNDAELAEYIKTRLGSVAVQLDWQSGNPIYDAILDATKSVLATDILDFLPAVPVQTVAMVEAWQLVTINLVPSLNYSSDGQRYDREALYNHAMQQLELAKKAAMRLGLYPNLAPPSFASNSVHAVIPVW